MVDSCDIDNGNRKVDSAVPPSIPYGSVSRKPTEETREEPDYYDDDVPRIQPGQTRNPVPPNNVEFSPEHRSPPGESGFFPAETPFGGMFPSDFGEFFKESSFGREEERPAPQRPTQAPVNKPPKKYAVSQTSELPPVIIKAEEQQPQANIPGPLKQLNKLINHASNYNQQHYAQNHQREPQRNQVGVERPIQQVKPQDRPVQNEKTILSAEDDGEQQNHNYNVKETSVPTKISPPPVKQRPFNLAAPTTPPVFKRPHYHHQVDPFGGIFNPETVILESGFKPIRTNDGPVPPLGFDVEARETVAKDVINDDTKVTSEPPSLVTLDPVFVASEPDHRRAQDPVPIPLPKAVVPVVPGPSAPVPKFPPNYQIDQPPIVPPFRAPPASQRQPLRPPFDGSERPGNNPRPLPPPPPPSRKKSGFASFFNFGSQRRREPPIPIASPVGSVSR